MGIEETASVKSPITKAFLEKTLGKKIVSFTTSGGSNPGDNYTSIMISIEVNLEDQKEPLHLLFKTFPHHPTRQKLLEESNLFLKEYQVYNDFVPELVKSQDGPTVLKPAFPELVAGAAIDYNGNSTSWQDADPILSNFILMVDLRKTHGYKLANKLQSQTYDHVKLVLQELAKFHAIGYAYKKKHNLSSLSEKFNCLEDPFFRNPDQRSTIVARMKGDVELIKENLPEYLKQNPNVDAKLQSFLDNPDLIPDLFAEFLDPQGMNEMKMESYLRDLPEEYADKPPLEEQWISVGHGDCWTNNMLFKSNSSGKPEAVCLVDLQIVRECCITADLVYFLFSSTDTTFRSQHLKEMLAWYHTKFTEYCQNLGIVPFPHFTLENLERKYHRSKTIGLLFSIMILPIILQKPETCINMESITVEDTSGNTGEQFAEMFSKMGRDDDDKQLLAKRFSQLFTELQEEGVL